MKTLTEVDLGYEGLLYVKQRLQGWWGLAKLALNLPILQGRAIAALPDGINTDRAKEFGTGGINIGDSEMRWLAARLLLLRSKFPESSLIIENTSAISTDRFICEFGGKMLFHESHVYHYLDSTNFSEEKIIDLIYSDRSFTITGFFVRYKINDNNLSGYEVDDHEIERFADNIIEIILDSYDRESL